MTMKLSIAILFAAISCCAAMNCDTSKWKIKEQECMYYAHHLLDMYHIYDHAQESPSQIKNMLMTFAGMSLTLFTQEFSNEVDCPVNEVLKIMGVRDATIEHMESLLLGLTNITNENAESAILDAGHGIGHDNIQVLVEEKLKGITKVLRPLLKQNGIDLKTTLQPVSKVVEKIMGVNGLDEEVNTNVVGPSGALEKTLDSVAGPDEVLVVDPAQNVLEGGGGQGDGERSGQA